MKIRPRRNRKNAAIRDMVQETLLGVEHLIFPVFLKDGNKIKESIDSLSPKRLDYLCAGECYNPTNEREIIEKMEIIKITPQIYAGEAVSPLIQDPWRTIPCQGKGECIIEFEDQNFTRDSIYYVRAIQEPTPGINGSLLSERENFSLCKGSFRTDLQDDCLSMTNERAWSSPIYVNKP